MLAAAECRKIFSSKLMMVNSGSIAVYLAEAKRRILLKINLRSFKKGYR